VYEDIHQLKAAALRTTDPIEANALLLRALGQTHVAESEYLGLLQSYAQVAERRGDVRGFCTAKWYLFRSEGPAPLSRLLATLPIPVDRARSRLLLGDPSGAARDLESCNLLAAAAVMQEKAKAYPSARTLWARLSQARGAGRDAYVEGLIAFNLARTAKLCDDKKQARDAIVGSVRLLEEAADLFESIGQRERAFDCFQVLIQIGKESETFENVIEGYVNCIRILREDNLKYFALQYFDEAIASAKKAGELSAAATLAREASEYARVIGMGPASTHYAIGQAQFWYEHAQAHLARGAPAAIAENSVLAAILALGETGQFARIGHLYNELSLFPLEPARVAHYTRASARYADLTNDNLLAAPMPAHLKQDAGAPDVWHVDVVEWEQGGRASEACADILLDPRWPDLMRRRALVARLTAFAVEDRGDDATTVEQRVRLCEQLGQLQLYGVLSPLEKMFESRVPRVRAAVMSALRTLFFKRSFVTIRAGLKDSDQAVVTEASRATAELHFQHAFDPLSRIVRESPRPEVRAAALRALSRVESIDAAEFLISVLDSGAPQDRASAVFALKEAKGMKFVESARAALGTASPSLVAAIREVFAARGIQG
jgi:tetratricopeptide (TPR) repeat protein